ncbi:MAG: hypothetical protein J6M62_12155 [Selenomonadaceae bacterium]|nr:hypothetical protein [Selenomonadaceae bacterium]MBO6305808.1 hypothetical protein [Selenomonadaceae bacterium]MBR3622411.1 hypothetical protein [Selenomonadaceae bacterium]
MATPSSGVSKRKEWMCTHCGKKEIRFVSAGRPQPGKCPRKNGDKPHTWVVNRTM